MQSTTTTRRFTGWHMATIMVAFFALVIAVNVLMATYAVSTFGGEVVENSYVASQRYNGWLAAARAQRQIGWHATPSVDGGHHLHIAVTDASGRALDGRVIVTARHPLGAMPDQRVELTRDADGYVADKPLPAGRWLLHIDISANGHDARFEDEIAA